METRSEVLSEVVPVRMKVLQGKDKSGSGGKNDSLWSLGRRQGGWESGARVRDVNDLGQRIGTNW